MDKRIDFGTAAVLSPLFALGVGAAEVYCGGLSLTS